MYFYRSRTCAPAVSVNTIRPNHKTQQYQSKGFKREFRNLTKSWNKQANPKLNKVRANNIVKTVPHLKVTLCNDLEINALLDTGSTQNIISHNLFKLLDKKKLVFNNNICTGNLLAANNSQIKIFSQCLVKIKIANFSWKIPFLVVENISFDVILGTPFISKTKFVLDLSCKIGYFKFNPTTHISLYFDELLNDSLSNINIGCPEMQKEVDELIKDYPNVFTDAIGQALNFEVDLKLIDNEPVSLRPYFLSPPVLNKVKNIIDDWLKQDIIEPSTSVYSSPAFLTSKDRLVVNYAQLNKKLQRMDFPIGDLANYCQHLQGAAVYSVIDLKQSFLQCCLSERSRHITAFNTIFAKYQFKRVPFGLHVGSSVLSSYLDNIFSDIKFKYVINFCDDIIIYSKDKYSHLEHVKEVVKRLSDNNLTVNVSKARLFCNEISFLGNVIKNNTVTIDQDRTVNVRRFPPPKTVRQVMQYLGMTGFFSKYIKDYASICEPLYKLKRKNVKFVWSPECQSAFETLKNCITNPPVLQLADFNKPFVLMTDASNNAAGGCLMQENDKGDLLPIAYYSKKFTESERKFTTYEKEALSVILCMEKWHEFLEVRPFKLFTDNESLSYVLNTKRKIGRLARWVERLLNIPFSVEFKRSEDNQLADALSRMFDDGCETNDRAEQCEQSGSNSVNVVKIDLQKIGPDSENILPMRSQKRIDIGNSSSNRHFWNLISDIPLAFTDLKQHQLEDFHCNQIIESIKNKTNSECFYLKNDVLMYKTNNSSKGQIYLPLKLVNLVFNFFHTSVVGGHPGIVRSQKKICYYFYRPDLNALIKERVKNCKICTMSKSMQRKYEGQLISAPIDSAMKCLFIDLIGPLPRSKMGNQYLLVIVDGFTKYLWLTPLRDCTTKQISSKLENLVFNNFGVPEIVVTDNASYFRSHSFKQFTFKNFITHRTIAPYRAASNRCERYIRDVTTLLRCYYQNCQNLWDNSLGYLQCSLNTAVNSSTGFTAFSLMFNHPCHNSLSNIWKLHDLISDNVSLEQRKENLIKAVNNVKRSVQINSQRKKYLYPYNKHPYNLGSIVYIKTHFQSSKINNFSKKLAPRYVGPYCIIYFLTPVTVLVQNRENLREVKKVHIIDLKLGM